jgi:hypothetical protein
MRFSSCDSPSLQHGARAESARFETEANQVRTRKCSVSAHFSDVSMTLARCPNPERSKTEHFALARDQSAPIRSENARGSKYRRKGVERGRQRSGKCGGATSSLAAGRPNARRAANGRGRVCGMPAARTARWRGGLLRSMGLAVDAPKATLSSRCSQAYRPCFLAAKGTEKRSKAACWGDAAVPTLSYLFARKDPAPPATPTVLILLVRRASRFTKPGKI